MVMIADTSSSLFRVDSDIANTVADLAGYAPVSATCFQQKPT